MRCGHKNCVTCPYDYCIAEKVDERPNAGVRKIIDEKTRQKRKAYHHATYMANQKYYQDKARNRARALAKDKKMKRQNTCCWCSKEFDKPHEMIKYHKNYFCGEECLGEYLVSKAQQKDEVKVIWVDTEENIEVLAREEAAQW